MSDTHEALERFRSLLDQVLAQSRRVEFDAENPQHLAAVALHGTVLEYGAGILELLRADNTTSAFVVLRSALEAFIDLVGTVKNSDYPHVMQLEFLAQNRRVLTDALSDTSENRYLRSLREHPESQAQLAEFDRAITALQDEGVKRLKVQERFALGDQLELYTGPYTLLCRHSHNNLGILERRHLRNLDGRIEAYYFQASTAHDIQLIVDTIAGLAANSLANLVALTTGQVPPDLPAVTAKLLHLRELWQSWPDVT